MSARISSLPVVVSANIADTDILPIVTGIASNTGVTKRVSITELRLKLGTTAPAGGRTVTSASTYLTNNAVFNVKDWGAFGDGVTDDRAFIQAAVDACVAFGGGTVYFPVGNFYLGNGTITVTNSGTVKIHFKGAGIYASNLMKGNTATGHVLTWNCTGAPTSIQDLGIIAQVGGNFNVDGLISSVGGMNGVIIERVWFNGLRNGCVLSGSDIYISHCLAELCQGNGFSFDRNVNAHNCTSYQNINGFVASDSSGVGYPPLSCSIVGCRSIEDTQIGCYINARINVELTAFQCQSSNGAPGTGYATGAAIVVNASSKVNISHPNISQCGTGIQFTGACADINIFAPIIDKISDTTAGKGYGIQLNSSCSDVTIISPRISRTYRSAIVMGAMVGFKIIGGRIADFGQGSVANDLYGIQLNGDAGFKTADIQDVDFSSATGVPIGWLAGAVGSFYIKRCRYSGAAGGPDISQAPKTTTFFEQTPSTSGDRGDASYSIVTFDVSTNRWDTALTANRTVTLPVFAWAGQRFRIVRTGLGAFTLTVQDSTPTTIKAIPASTAAFVDVEFNGTAWKLAGYGTL